MNKKFASLFLIALALIAYGQLEAQTLTVGEVFDYEVGDEFHIRSQGHVSAPVIQRLTVLDRSFSKAKDTVFYTIANNGYTTILYNYDARLVPRIDTQRIFYTNLGSPIFDAQLNDWVEGLNVIQDSVVVDTIRLPDSTLCSTSKNALHLENRHFEYEKAYAKKLGFIHEHQGGINGVIGGWNSRMFYYKKGNETCGKPDLKNSTPKIQPILEINVFPNPAYETLHIALKGNSNEPVNIDVLTMNGEILMTTSLLTPTTQLSIENLAAGTYLVKCKTSQTAHTELIIKN